MKSVRYGFILCLMILTSCSQASGPTTSITSKPPDARETLALEPDADIFQLDGAIYQANVEWVEELELTKKERIGEIMHQTQNADEFQNETATVLQVGSIIYSTNEGGGYVLVDVDGKLINYLLLTEG